MYASKKLTERDMNDSWVGDGVERRELGGCTDGAMKEDLSIEDRLWSGSGRYLFGPQVHREEITFVCREVIVDRETTLSEEHVGRIRSVRLYIAAQQTIFNADHTAYIQHTPYTAADNCLE